MLMSCVFKSKVNSGEAEENFGTSCRIIGGENAPM